MKKDGIPVRIIISPAKKMNNDLDSLPHKSLPAFISESEKIHHVLQDMDYTALKSLWRCNDAIATLNYDRLKIMDLHSSLTPALLSYEGIQYQYMAPHVFEYGHFDCLSEHLRILSGFYGLLRTFDGVIPYRLEMQANFRWMRQKTFMFSGEINWPVSSAMKRISSSIWAPRNTARR